MKNIKIIITKIKNTYYCVKQLRLTGIYFLFAWYDLWVGAFWDSKKKWLYILPIPMLGVILKFNNKSNPQQNEQ